MSGETRLRLEGMTCAACVRRVEKALLKVEGVESAQVNLATHESLVRHQASIDSALLIDSIRRAGYGASLASSPEKVQEKSIWALAVPLSLSGGVMAVSMAMHMRPLWLNIVLLVVTMVVVFGFGWPIQRAGWGSLWHRAPHMDALIAIGSSAAVVFSAVSMVRYADNPHSLAEHIHLETGAVIVALILLGRFLEERSKRRMITETEDLMRMAPQTALKANPGQEDLEVTVTTLALADHVRVLPGAVIPIDGIVIEGTSEVSEAMLTGEPMPVLKSPGDRVSAGTMNTHGAMIIETTALAGDSTLARLIKWVEHAQTSKAPIQRAADQISGVFVPVIIVLAVLTFLGYLQQGRTADLAMMPALAVLVVACPCALGLATPTAVFVATGRASQLGILFRDGATLEAVARLTRVALDKTGTLTKGEPEVVRVWRIPEVSEEQLLQTAAGVERNSEHPIARAISQKAGPGAAYDGFVAVPGSGARAEQTMVGKPEWLQAEGTSVPADWIAEADSLGMTTVGVAHQGHFLGLLGLYDEPTDSAAQAVSELKALGLAPVILSGDRHPSVQRIAERLGIQTYAGDLSPLGKTERLKDLGLGTGMVGDGINDAAALASAEVGFVVAEASDLARHAAPVALMRPDLKLLPRAIRIARRAMRTIRVNLMWAFGYNVVMLPLAILGHVPPMLAAGAMTLSSITVVLNSLRLKRAH